MVSGATSREESLINLTRYSTGVETLVMKIMLGQPADQQEIDLHPSHYRTIGHRKSERKGLTPEERRYALSERITNNDGLEQKQRSLSKNG